MKRMNGEEKNERETPTRDDAKEGARNKIQITFTHAHTPSAIVYKLVRKMSVKACGTKCAHADRVRRDDF